jgi:hypothetical protein
MPDILNPVDFTALVIEHLGGLQLNISTPEPLSIKVLYGENEPELKLELKALYEQYQQTPDRLPVLLEPLITEVGWTVNGTVYSFSDIAEHSLPLMRNLLAHPFSPREQGLDEQDTKGPLLFQELVNREEEHVVIQFVMAKNELVQPLFTGDMLRSYAEPTAFASNCLKNLRNVVLGVGLTLSEFALENFAANPYLVALRGGKYRQFHASLIAIPEVMKTLEETLQADEGVVAILPTREQLLVSANAQDEAIIQLGLLARYLKDEGSQPVSGFIWHFKDGLLKRVQTIDIER